MPELILLLLFPAIMTFAGAMDLVTMTIPNRITLALVAAFPLVLPFSGLDLMGVANHVGAGLLMLAVGIFMFARGWCGGGDAKLLAAAALWLGFENLPGYLMLVSMAGGVLVSAILAYRRMPPPTWLAGQSWAMRLHNRAVGVPYGIALSAAALWIYPSTFWFTHFIV